MTNRIAPFLLFALTSAPFAKDSESIQEEFSKYAQPLFKKYCYECHGVEKSKAGVRVDHLDGSVPDKEVRHWEIIRKLLHAEEMPPEDEPQPSTNERAKMILWIGDALAMARSRVRPMNGGARRLTVAQYRNTLHDLLGIEENLSGLLPPDGISKDGFVNNGQSMFLSPLMVETYFEIAEKSLDLAIVDPKSKPAVQAFQMELGHKINSEPYPDKLILGANSSLLANENFVVRQLSPEKNFAFNPFKMRTQWEFNEGYRGNDTVRGWREYDSIYHAVFACMRGTPGYPLGKSFHVAADGLLLRAAIPSEEIWQVDSTYGPRANFKISLRELPKHGRFRVKIKAARYDDALLLERGTPSAETTVETLNIEGSKLLKQIEIPIAGIYQADVFIEQPVGVLAKPDASKLSQALVGTWEFDGTTQSNPTLKELAGRITGGAKYVDSPLGQALDFDGKDDSVEVPRSKTMSVGTGNFTVAAWIRPTELRQAGIVVLGKYGWTHGWIFDMPNSQGILRLETSDSNNEPNGTVKSRPGVIRPNQWQHVAAVVRRGKNQTQLFVNGYPVGQGTIKSGVLDNLKLGLTIGRVPEANLFKGQIDSVRLYNRALDDAEIQALLAPAQETGMKLNPPPEKPQLVTLYLNEREITATRNQAAFLVLRLPKGPVNFRAITEGNNAPHQVNLTPLPVGSDLSKRFKRFEKRAPWLGVHLGLRRDCGSTFSPVQQPVEIRDKMLREYIFEGAINNYPSDNLQTENDNYLAGVREIGVRSEYTDGRERPRLRIRSVEFEGPYYESWPPKTHRRIFLDSAHKDQPELYAREIVSAFASRAFRRPVTKSEESSLLATWKSAFAAQRDFTQSIKDTLLTVLTSPQFLFLIEQSESPKPEPLTDYELASKLSYFLWNTSPDDRLLQLASEGKLHATLDTEITRLIHDHRFEKFTDEFVSQWLSLDKFDVVEMDYKRFPRLTRNVRLHLRREPVELFQYLIRENLPARHLLQSDFIMANEVTASYYGLGDQTEDGFTFMPVAHRSKHLGGLLAQTSILAGLSDGREANAVKRGAWLARKIIADPPDDPPPNVPSIEEIDPTLPLRERLALHRDHKGCAGCHAGIDPWGVPLEQFDASGFFRSDYKDVRSILPDNTEVADYLSLRSYLVGTRMNRVAFSVLKHLATYATGRTLTYNELVFLEEKGLNLLQNDYMMQDLVKFVINSDIFLKK